MWCRSHSINNAVHNAAWFVVCELEGSVSTGLLQGVKAAGLFVASAVRPIQAGAHAGSRAGGYGRGREREGARGGGVGGKQERRRKKQQEAAAGTGGRRSDEDSMAISFMLTHRLVVCRFAFATTPTRSSA